MSPMRPLEAIGRTCIDDDRSHVWRRIASPLIEIDEPRVRPGGIGPEFPALERTDRRRHFETLAGNLAGKVRRRGVDWDEHVAAGRYRRALRSTPPCRPRAAAWRRFRRDACWSIAASLA